MGVVDVFIPAVGSISKMCSCGTAFEAVFEARHSGKESS